MKGGEYMESINMNVKDLKNILATCPDDMDVIIPVMDETDANIIYAFRHVRTAGILSSPTEEYPALCLNSSENGCDISEQIKRRYLGGTTCDRILF